MSASDKYTAETITWIKPWTNHLFSFRLTRNAAYRFIPGQFARLGVKKFSEEKGEYIVWRAYSIVSANYDEFLEFYSIVVPGGEFTSELATLEVGDTVYVEKMNYGFLTTDRFENGKDLWMLSTGTGLAPFISVLYDLSTWEDYENVIIVHSVRDIKELAYADTIEAFKEHEYFAEFAQEKLKYVQIVTREPGATELSERIPELIKNGKLEEHLGIPLSHERSRIMICGNPDMVDDTRHSLTDKGYTVSRRGQPGHMAVENYW